MRALLYLPAPRPEGAAVAAAGAADEADALAAAARELAAARDALLEKKWAKAARLTLAELSGEEALDQALAAVDPKHGLVVLDPPREVAEVERLEAKIAAQVPGKPRPLRAVAYRPAPKASEAEDAWRQEVQAVWHHFFKDRRGYRVERPRKKELKQALVRAATHGSLIRWGALAPASALAVVVLAGLLLFRDPLVLYALVAGGQSLAGAKVEIAELQTSLTLDTDSQRVVVADRRQPLQNLVEVEEAALNMSLAQLMSGRLHADRAILKGVRFGTARDTPGTLPGADAAEATPPEPLTEAGSLQFTRGIEDLLDRVRPPALDDFQTVRLARELEAEAAAREAKVEAGVASVQSKLSALRSDAQQALGQLDPSALPPEVAEVEQRLAAAGGGAAAELAAARAELERARQVDYGPEERLLAEARQDLADARRALASGRETLAEAEAIEEVSMWDAPKVLKLTARLSAAPKEVHEELSSAREAFAKARQQAEQKHQQAQQRLTAAREQLAAAQAAAEQQAGGAAAAVDALAGDLERARSSLAARQREVSGQLASLEERLGALKAEAEAVQTEVRQASETLAGAPERLEQALTADEQMLRERYAVDELGVEPLARGLLGERAVAWLERLWQVYQWLGPNLGKGSAEAALGGRLPGVTYSFPQPGVNGPPPSARLWVGEAEFSGEVPLSEGGEPLLLAGRVQNVCSDLVASGRPIEGRFKAAQGAERLAGEFRVDPDGAVTLKASADGVDLAGTELGGGYAPRGVAAGRVSVALEATVREGRLEAGLSFRFQGLKLEPAAERPDSEVLAEMLDAVYGEVGDLEASLQLAFAGGAPAEARLKLDEAGRERLAGLLEQAAAARMGKLRREAEASLEQRVAAPRAQALAKVEQVRGEVCGEARGELERVTAATLPGAKRARAALATLEARAEGLTASPAGGAPGGESQDAAVSAAAAEADAVAAGVAREQGALQQSLAKTDQELGATEKAEAELKRKADAEARRLRELAGG